MSTFTLCYSGTDCFLDQALVLRKYKEMASYNSYSGYIPSKTYKLISESEPDEKLSVTMNGCGGPYETDRDTLPVRVWSIGQDPDPEITDTWAECSLAPFFSNDSVTGRSLEIITIAGLARMLGVTLHLVKTGGLSALLDEDWDPQHTMGYTRDDLAYPQGDNGMWNNSVEATSGYYCLRWSKDDDAVIQEFLKKFNRVVLLGHSRGGVSCIIAANYIAEWFGSLEIKICALDPVPGTGFWWEVLTSLPGKSTMEYVGIYAIDETSGGFNGVVPKVKANYDLSWDPLSPTSEKIPDQTWKTSNYELLYTRGRHATVPGSRSAQGRGEADPNDDSVGSSGNLANAYAMKKLLGWGVPVAVATKEQIAAWVRTMNGYSDHFASMRNTHYGPVNLLGKMNGWAYYNARGVSSTDGRNPKNWMYLEAFIVIAEGDNADTINTQRGLIDMGVRQSYYAKFGGTAKVHPWIYLADACSK